MELDELIYLGAAQIYSKVPKGGGMSERQRNNKSRYAAQLAIKQARELWAELMNPSPPLVGPGPDKNS